LSAASASADAASCVAGRRVDRAPSDGRPRAGPASPRQGLGRAAQGVRVEGARRSIPAERERQRGEQPEFLMNLGIVAALLTQMFYARLTTTSGPATGRGQGGLVEEIEIHPDGRLTRSTGGGGGAPTRSAPLSQHSLARARALLAASGVLHPSTSDAAWPEPESNGPGCELEVVDGVTGAHVSFSTTRGAGFGSAAAVATSPDPAGLGAFCAAVADLRAFAIAALAMHNAAPASGPGR